MKFFFIFNYILLFFSNYYIIKLEKERGNRMNITVKTDLYIVKEIIKKTTLTKRLNVGDKINLIGYLDSSNSSYAKLKSTQFQLVINGKKTDIFMPQRKMETFLKEQLLVVNISKDDVINSFEEQDLKSVKLEDTILGNDFVPIEKVLKAYKSDEPFKELTRLFYNDLVVDFARTAYYKGNDSYDYYFKVLYEKENHKTLVIYKIENNWNNSTLTRKLKASTVEFKVLK